MSQELVNDSKNESDSCHPYSLEVAVEVFFDDVNLMLFWVFSVYCCIEMSPKNSLSSWFSVTENWPILCDLVLTETKKYGKSPTWRVGEYNGTDRKTCRCCADPDRVLIWAVDFWFFSKIQKWEENISFDWKLQQQYFRVSFTCQ